MSILNKINRKFLKLYGYSKCVRQPNPIKPGKVVVTLFHDFEGDYSGKGRGEPCIEAAHEMLRIQLDHGVTCTYNTVAKLANDHIVFIKKIVDAGNEIASHSYDHKLLSCMDSQQQYNDIDNASKLFKKIGYAISGLRCPQSLWTRSVMANILDYNYKWSAENGNEPHPYIYHKYKDHCLWRFPIRGDDWMYQSDCALPEKMVDYWKGLVIQERTRGRYAAIGFHPWIEYGEQRLDAYESFLQWLTNQDDVEIVPFGKLCEQLNQYNKDII